MCYIVPRQRLSARSGPGQLVDRGFSGSRIWGKTSFPPERSPENRFLPRETLESSVTQCFTRKHFRQPVNKYRGMGVQGNHSPARRRPSFRCLGAKSPKVSPYSQSASGSQENSLIPTISGNKKQDAQNHASCFHIKKKNQPRCLSISRACARALSPSPPNIRAISLTRASPSSRVRRVRVR